MVSDLTLISFNARGLRQSKKRRQLFAYIHRHNIDISFIQETHSCIADMKYWMHEWGGTIIFSHGLTGSRGVFLLIKPSLTFEIIKKDICPHGRFILADLKISERIFTLVGIYAPNVDDPNFFHSLSHRITNFCDDTTIIAGDFNLVFNFELDKKGGNLRTLILKLGINAWI
ncbi:hypothetical protein HOLleu_10466 [Holothuria leucospilota]|uniref:exodeoxyribonuclease III n=1 Tax=Holothuria leucospilota TaxID=206669 RepID=A0A9Q1CE47_HOLLE|nr:hypothetical protein HOLleu_10466 [Holothuria leucospilota]